MRYISAATGSYGGIWCWRAHETTFKSNPPSSDKCNHWERVEKSDELTQRHGDELTVQQLPRRDNCLCLVGSRAEMIDHVFKISTTWQIHVKQSFAHHLFYVQGFDNVSNSRKAAIRTLSILRWRQCAHDMMTARAIRVVLPRGIVNSITCRVSQGNITSDLRCGLDQWRGH